MVQIAFAVLLTIAELSQSTAIGTPQGWIDDKVILQNQQFPALAYGLKGPGKVLLFNKSESTYLVECDGKLYLWNDVSDGVDRIDEPTKLEEICKILPDASKLKTTNLA